MIEVEQIRGVRLFREAHEATVARGVQGRRLVRHQVVRRIIDRCATDLIETTLARLTGGADRVCRGRPDGRSGASSSYSPEMAGLVRELKELPPREHVPPLPRGADGGQGGPDPAGPLPLLVAEPLQLPPQFQARIERDGLHRVVCDYIAGMTDRFALDEHRKLFDPLVRV